MGVVLCKVEVWVIQIALGCCGQQVLVWKLVGPLITVSGDPCAYIAKDVGGVCPTVDREIFPIDV